MMLVLTLSGCASEVVGPQGPKGDAGEAGQNGEDGKIPFIGENGNWWFDNVDTGVPATGPKGEDGEQGNQGEPGKDGKDGESGKDGEQGSPGEAGKDGENGEDGENGLNGKSAYDLYCEINPNYEGDEEQWLDDLINGRLGKKDIYQVTFVFNNGWGNQIIEVEDGKKCPKPEDPTFSGYVFDGWYNAYNEKWVFGGFSVTENITLSAHWIGDSAEYTPIIINEICSKNKYSFVDEYTEVPDWIELHNPSLQSISLLNCGFTDDLSQPYKFKFGDIFIQSDEYLVLCADNRPENTKPEVHLPFTLSQKNGGTLYLISPTGKLLQQVTFPGLKDDITLGRADNGSYTTFNPTAGSKNKIVWVDKEILKQPKFSKNSGVYASEFQLSLTSSEGDIYYTTDCSDPTIESTKYTENIRIFDRSSVDNIYANREDMTGLGSTYLPESPVNKCMVVKAIVIDSSGNVSPITTKSFWIDQDHYFEQGIGVASLSADPDSLFGYNNGIYVFGEAYDAFKDTIGRKPTADEMMSNNGANFLKSGIESERVGDLSYFNHKGNLKSEQKVGIRIHGNYSRLLTKKSFRLYSRYTYDTNNKFDYKFNDKKCETIIFRNGGNTQNFQLTSSITSSIARETDMNFDTQDFSATYLFLNGEFWGVYYITDRYDDRYIEEKYGIEEFVMIKEGEVEEGFKTDYSLYSSYAALKNLNFTIEENFVKFVNLVDIDSFIDYTLFMSYIGIVDWYWYKNFQMWASRKTTEKPYEDRKLRFMLFDGDASLSVTGTQVDENMFETDKGTIALLKALLKNEYFNQCFSQKAASFIQKLSGENIINTINDIYETYVDFLDEDCYRFSGRGHSNATYDRVIYFLTNRHIYYSAQINSLIN